MINESQKPFKRPITKEEWDSIWKSQADGYNKEESPVTSSIPDTSN